VNGPFFPLLDVLHGILSILDPAPVPVPLPVDFAEAVPPGAVPAGDCLPSRGAGRGKIGLSFVVAVLVDDVDAGDDFEEVFDRGEGPLTSGEGVSVGMLGGFV
jgi:hypothetical protein